VEEAVHAKIRDRKKLLLRLEILFPYAAKRADPICRDIFKSSSRGDTAVRIADCGIIHISADFAYVLFHNLKVFNWS
jgi:hypothetical protein